MLQSRCAVPQLLETLLLDALGIKVCVVEPSNQSLLDAGPLVIRDTEIGRVAANALDNYVFSDQLAGDNANIEGWTNLKTPS